MPIFQLAFDIAPVATVGLLLAGAFGVAIAAERTIILARSRLAGHGRPFIERIIPMVQAGQIDEALAACSSTRAVLPDVGLIVLRTRLREERDLLALSEAAVRSTTPQLTRRLRYIPALATAAALSGAAGSAAALTELAGAGAARIGESLAPLALGLGVAAPLAVIHAFLANQFEALLAQVAEFASRLVNALLDRPDVRLGHR